MIDDGDLQKAATMLLQQHGANAARYAAEWANALIESGNAREGRKFAKIVDAIAGLTGQAGQNGGTKPLRSPLPRRKRI